MFLPREEEGGRGLWVGIEVVAENLHRLRHHDLAHIVLSGIRREILDLESGREGNAQTIRDGGAWRHGFPIKTAGQGGLGNGEAIFVGDDPQVADVVAILIAAADVCLLQLVGQQPEPAIVVAVIVCRRVLPGDGHVEAVILAHSQASEEPVLGVGVDDLGLIQVPTGLVIAPGGSGIGEVLRYHFALVGHHLHQPDHPHLLGVSQAVAAGLVGHAGREGHPSAAGLIGNHVQGHVEQHVAGPVLISHGDAVGLERFRVNHVVRAGVGDIAQGDTGGEMVHFLQGDEVLAVGQVHQFGVGDGLRTAGDVFKLVDQIAGTGTGAGVDAHLVHRRLALEVKGHTNAAPILFQPYGSADPALVARRDINVVFALQLEAGARLGEGQGEGATTAHLDLQHGDQAHVPVLEPGIAVAVLLRNEIGKRGVVALAAHDLAVLIAAGPVQDIQGVGQVLRIGRAQLEIHQDGVVLIGEARLAGQVVHHQVEGVGASEGCGVAQDGLGREVNLVGDAVVVAVQVKEVRGAVVVGVAAGRGGVGRRPILAGGALRALQGIGLAIMIGVRVNGVRVPVFASVFKAHNLQIVADAVAVAVKAGGRRWVGAQAQDFPSVLQAIIVGIFPGRVCIVLLSFVVIGQAVFVGVGVFLFFGAG